MGCGASTVQHQAAPNKISNNECKCICKLIIFKRGTFNHRFLVAFDQLHGLSDCTMYCKCKECLELSNKMDTSVPGVWCEVAEVDIDPAAWKVACLVASAWLS